jgi:hypothetical protein
LSPTINRETIKNFLGELPMLPEVYWQLRQEGKPVTAKFALNRLENSIRSWKLQASAAPSRHENPKRVLIFGTLRYWIEHATALAISLAGLGHEVRLAFLPYAVWQEPMNQFDLRRQNIYAKSVLSIAEPLVRVTSYLDHQTDQSQLPDILEQFVREVALKDTQYTQQRERVDEDSALYLLRYDRNLGAAQAAWTDLKNDRPDVVILPNGTILEFGVLYKVATWLGIPVTTYEFGEQRGRIWVAQDQEVMRQDTTAVWERYKDVPLEDDQLKKIQDLFISRQRADLWQNFARKWQGVPSAGGQQIRSTLGLDERPVILLATNVIGDSLTLGRQVFSDSMTNWLQRTVEFFAFRPDVQLIVRIHPGELITRGPSVVDVVNEVFEGSGTAQDYSHVHVIPADAEVNTYDLIEIADLGLVYTTTVGMEMAMSGTPCIIVGNTHYRARGFTLDPESWDDYFEILARVLDQPEQYRLENQQVQLAWNYAYRFFFDYPLPFPWHLVHFWDDIAAYSMEQLLSDEGVQQYGKTLNFLIGEPYT